MDVVMPSRSPPGFNLHVLYLLLLQSAGPVSTLLLPTHPTVGLTPESVL